MRKVIKKKMFKIIIASTMTLMMLFTMTACGSESKKSGGSVTKVEAKESSSDSGKESSSDKGSGKDNNKDAGKESGKDSDKDSNKGSGKESGKDDGKEDFSNVTLPEDSIILVFERSNYAWGYHESGSFIDSKGDVYHFNFSADDNIRVNDIKLSLLEKLEIVKKYDKPVSKIDEDMLKKIYGLGSQVNKKAGYEEEDIMCDYGQDSIYFVPEGSKEPLLIYTYGDVTKTPKDKNARKLYKYTDTDVKTAMRLNMTGESGTTFNFAEYVCITDLHSSGGNYDYIHAKCEDAKGGVYKAVTDNKQVVKDFVAKIGFGEEKINEFFENIYEPNQDDMLYFIELYIDGQLGPDRNTCGLMIKDGQYTLIPSPDNKIRDEYGCDALDYYCHIVGYPLQGKKLSDMSKDGVFAEYWTVIESAE
ncbi:MAG: hypothetical protein IKR27_08160 [Lachnospiraceae bacterium]|nr:hypothetical protein [Lachnospiraceae bacterium]